MKLIYENPLSCEGDLRGFVLEGSARLSFSEGRLRMENARSAAEGQKANYVLWCPEEFPPDVRIEWKFRPLKEPGLAILFFSARGRNGEDVLDGSLAKREGDYMQYHHGDINAFHVSYFRRKEPEERALHVCNLRKSYGLHLVAQGGDPIPDADECNRMYRIALEKKENRVRFLVEDVEVFLFEDDGVTYGSLLSGGKIGFRQLAPMIAEYADFKVYEL